MTFSSKAFKATRSVYSNPVLIGENDIVESYSEPVTYTSEMEKVANRLQCFLTLENGWDGYSAVVPKEVTIGNVMLVLDNLKDKYIKLLNEEDVVPSPYGTVSLYFEDEKSNELSIEFGKEYIGINGAINGEEIIVDDLPIYQFDSAIDYINKLTPSK